MTKGRFPGPISRNDRLVIAFAAPAISKKMVLQVPSGNNGYMGQIEGICNADADCDEVRRR